MLHRGAAGRRRRARLASPRPVRTRHRGRADRRRARRAPGDRRTAPAHRRLRRPRPSPLPRDPRARRGGRPSRARPRSLARGVHATRRGRGRHPRRPARRRPLPRARLARHARRRVRRVRPLDELGVERVVCSPLPFAPRVRDRRPRRSPTPAPATLGLLEGAALVGVDTEAELVTPTGAAIAATVVEEWGGASAADARSRGLRRRYEGPRRQTESSFGSYSARNRRVPQAGSSCSRPTSTTSRRSSYPTRSSAASRQVRSTCGPCLRR